jgi:hypothetical protein
MNRFPTRAIPLLVADMKQHAVFNPSHSTTRRVHSGAELKIGTVEPEFLVKPAELAKKLSLTH